MRSYSIKNKLWPKMFYWDTHTPFANNFYVKDKQLIYKSHDPSQITSLYSIHRNTFVSMKFKMKKITWGIYIGLITKNRKNK